MSYILCKLLPHTVEFRREVLGLSGFVSPFWWVIYGGAYLVGGVRGLYVDIGERHEKIVNLFYKNSLLSCSIENDNEYSENAIAVFSSNKKMVGHILEPLAKILFPLSIKN